MQFFRSPKKKIKKKDQKMGKKIEKKKVKCWK